ncbi:hypothetical protein MNB_SV-15-1293 [hydrothermal vent metagenome]|uniref:Uncharacterized protein n=1 Tax=hydrothermal vent metagenome TaxID=652676 RepID=A0A1W1EJQ4_9ZZZZ
MQTIAVEIQDNYVQQFINYVKNHSNNMRIKNNNKNKLIISKDVDTIFDNYSYDISKFKVSRDEANER